jgi:hypothetical protein
VKSQKNIFAYDVILHIENSKESTKILKLISNLSNCSSVSGDAINIVKYCGHQHLIAST